MTREEVIKQLKELADDGDFERAHSEADDLIIEFLKSLGYADIAEAYDKVGKWYA